MAELNYMNPQAMRPEIDYKPRGIAAGYRYNEQEQEYLRQLAIQDEFRKLQLMENTQKTKEYMGGADLRSLEGQLKQRQIQGQLPYAGELAGAQAQAGIAKAGFDSKVTHGAEAVKEGIRKIAEGKSNDEVAKMTRDMAAGAALTNQALAIQQSQGLLAAQSFMDTQLKRMKEAGMQMPPGIQNPASWQPFRDAAQMSIEQLQKIQLEQQKGQNAQATARINQAGNLAAAQYRAGGSNPNIERRIVALNKEIAQTGGTEAQKQELKRLVSAEWFDFLKSAMIPPTQVENYRKEFYESRGVEPPGKPTEDKSGKRITLPNGVVLTPLK